MFEKATFLLGFVINIIFYKATLLYSRKFEKNKINFTPPPPRPCHPRGRVSY
jgi:hypothetical protein